MNVPVEAQSLSALTNLFANPPQYPRNPTHEIRDSLSLYIVRVPGSKDVFLTPLKPPTKASISLEAIQSSLYYLHVVTEEDEEVKKSLDEQQRSEEFQRTNPPIHRKPLPTVPHSNYPPSQRPAPPPKSYPSYQPGLDGNPNASQSERYAARGAHIRFTNETDGQDGMSYRGPPSPRRFQMPAQKENSNRNSVASASDPFTSEHLPPLQQELHGAGRSNLNTLPLPFNDFASYTPSPIWTPEPRSPVDLPGYSFTKHATKLLTITLIRRDPVSGNQWNVGSICLDENPSSNMPLNRVSIEINTPGYSRFISRPEFSRSQTSLSDADMIKEALANGTLSHGGQQEATVVSDSFTRLADYQRHTVERRQPRIHRRKDSSDSYTKSPSPTKQTRQVYSFTSPWHGICYFSNGIDGKSLKCRHTLASSAFAEDESTINVAELRFNLPWSVLTSTSEKEPEENTLPVSKLIGQRSGRETIKKGFQHFRNLSRDKSSQDDERVLQELPKQSRVEPDLDRLSLKLGRERAGGGFKGTSAKLGKLIIEDEGLKMCDLVVAACMGVWWQHYEKRGE